MGKILKTLLVIGGGILLLSAMSGAQEQQPSYGIGGGAPSYRGSGASLDPMPLLSGLAPPNYNIDYNFPASDDDTAPDISGWMDAYFNSGEPKSSKKSSRSSGSSRSSYRYNNPYSSSYNPSTDAIVGINYDTKKQSKVQESPSGKLKAPSPAPDPVADVLPQLWI